MLSNIRTITIEWGDCDPAGIVYFPRYFEYFDACTSALFERAGLPKPGMLKKYGLVGIPLVDARAQFFAPCSFGDRVEVESLISEWGRSSFSVQHKLRKQGVLSVEGSEKRVWTVRDSSDPQKIKGQAIPQEVIEKFIVEK